MSVIMRNLAGNSVSGGTSKGFPPGDVSNISISPGTKCALLKWEDPEVASSYNNITLSTWYSTIIVRKEGSAPTSIKDGVIVLENTERNKYKDEYFTDNNVTVGKTYYYRFYTMSTDKIYNDSTNMICHVLIRDYATILKNNTWDNIAAASELGIAQDIWNIGDEIDITLSSYSGSYEGYYVDSDGWSDSHIYNFSIPSQTVTLQIWDFNHFDKSDGSGKAGICFGMKELLDINNRLAVESHYGSSVSWDGTWFKSTFLKNVFEKVFPNEVAKYIKTVDAYTSCNSSNWYNWDNMNGVKTEENIFIPGITEVCGELSDYPKQARMELKQSQLSIFTDNSSRKKVRRKDAITNPGIEGAYLTRSGFDEKCGYVVNTNGNYGKTSPRYYPSYKYDVCFCFNI